MDTTSKLKVDILVRKARHDDLSQVVALGAQFHEESKFSNLCEFVPQDFEQTALSIIEERTAGSLFVADMGGVIVGIAGAVFFPFYFNFSSVAAQEVFLWAAPEHRSGIGMLLLDQLEEDAMTRGGSVFMTGAIAGLRDDAVARRYRMRGYSPGENTFMRRLSS